MAKRTIVNPKGTFLRRCEVTGDSSISICNKKAVTRIKDIVCKHLIDNKPFWVCVGHKKEFLKCEKGEEPHYKEVRKRANKGR